jgi:epoxide hydrolase-like predicted phosphatase
MVKEIKNIIFDLGGVIINLDMLKTIRLFESLGIPHFAATYNQFAQTEVFDWFDKGHITEEEFFNSIRHTFHLKQSTDQLVSAWNAMLLDIPGHRLKQLKWYKSKYRTFLLSNTNETHIQSFERYLQQAHQLENLSVFFEKDYYSCRMGMRKPDTDIFEFVLRENDLDPSETVFIDDTINHIRGAASVGLHTIHLPKGEEFDTHLKHFLSL